MGMAALADCPVLLCGDIDRGLSLIHIEMCIRDSHTAERATIDSLIQLVKQMHKGV